MIGVIPTVAVENERYYFLKEGLEDYVELEEDGIVVVASPTFPKSYNLPALGLSSLKHTIKAVF